MYPVICKIGPLSIYSYGLMVALAALVCSFLMAHDARKVGIASDVIFDLMFWVVVAGLIGARVFFIGLNFSYFVSNPVEMIMVQKGGLSWQGGLIAGALFGIGFLRKQKLPFLKTLDLVAPYIALGQSIGRVGCFLNGCCYGKKLSWGIYFPVHHEHLHPTQLYSSFGLLIIFFVLKFLQSRKVYEGQIFVNYLFLAASLRFCVEFFRADHYTTLWGLSIYQYVCLIILGAAFYVQANVKSRL